MNNETNDTAEKYTLATRHVGLEELIVTGVMTVLMVIGACLISDKRFLFVPILFAVVIFAAFVSLLFRYITEPKTAIQADLNGIYFYYRNGKEIFIEYKDIVEVAARGVRDRYGYIRITTQTAEYRSINIREDTSAVASRISFLLERDEKQSYLERIEIRSK